MSGEHEDADARASVSLTAPQDDTTPALPATPATPALDDLAQHTPARVALRRAGTSSALATREVLAFALAHAQARDAVHAALDVAALAAALRADGWPTPLVVASAAPDRAAYLARPDWGRRLAAASVATLRAHVTAGDGSAALPNGAGIDTPENGDTGLPVATDDKPSCDLAVVIADGLSAVAAQRHAVPLLAALRPRLTGLRLAPPVLATQARVALADEVGALLNAPMVLVLIGERPGLSAPDSLGAYLTWAPRVGRSDAERQCVSNIRPGGLGLAAAAAQLAALVAAVRAQGHSGVGLVLPPSGSEAPLPVE